MAFSKDEIVAQLQQAIERQAAQIADLQSKVAELSTRSHSQRSARSRGVNTSRRRLLKRLAMLGAGLSLAGAAELTVPAVQAAPADSSDGYTLQSSEIFSDGPFAASLPPLDSSVTWSRGINHTDTAPTAQQQAAQHIADNPSISGQPPTTVKLLPYSGTHELLSLIYEVTPAASEFYAYPLYVQLRTAHDSGDCTGINSTMFQTGGGWATAIHAEPHQDEGAGITIGVNVEANRSAGTGRVIGANVLSSQGGLNEAVNIQTGDGCSWETGLNFDYGSQGTRAIWIQGKWVVGLDLGNNHMRMNAGQKICLEDTDGVYLTYNPHSQRIEFWRFGSLVASF